MTLTSLVSIIIPVWNEEKYIDECLQTILAQSYPHFECLLIDDGSTDSTTKIIKAWGTKDPRFKLISKIHSGIIHSINLGFEHAQGSIICRMDGDDRMPPERLKLQVAELEKRGLNALVTGSIHYFSDNPISDGYQKYEQWLNTLKKPQQFLLNAFIECPVAAPSWMMYTESVEKIGHFDDDIYPEDYNFMLKALLSGISFYSLSKPVLEWREYPERTSRISDNCTRSKFWDVRARHLPTYIHTHTPYTSYVIWGAGLSGKSLCKALHDHSSFAQLIIDHHPSRIGTTLVDTKVIHYNSFNEYSGHFILIAIGKDRAKNETKQWLEKQNKQEGIDFIFCC